MQQPWVAFTLFKACLLQRHPDIVRTLGSHDGSVMMHVHLALWSETICEESAPQRYVEAAAIPGSQPEGPSAAAAAAAAASDTTSAVAEAAAIVAAGTGPASASVAGTAPAEGPSVAAAAAAVVGMPAVTAGWLLLPCVDPLAALHHVANQYSCCHGFGYRSTSATTSITTILMGPGHSSKIHQTILFGKLPQM